MTIKILRSTTVGNRPTGKLYGQPYVNIAENQFGVMNASNVAQDLLGVPMFSPSKTYVAGNAVNNAGLIYVALVSVAAGAFNSTQWSLVATQAYVAANALGVLSLQTVNMSGANFVAFTNIDTTYEEYEIDFRSLQVSAGALPLNLQVSSDNGASWISSSSYYYSVFNVNADGTTAIYDSGSGQISIPIWPGTNLPTASSQLTNTVQGKITLVEPAVAGYNKSIRWTAEGWGIANVHSSFTGVGSYFGGTSSSVALNAFRLVLPSGNTFTNGTAKLYGTKK